jgi:hypothetical protein
MVMARRAKLSADGLGPDDLPPGEGERSAQASGKPRRKSGPRIKPKPPVLPDGPTLRSDINSLRDPLLWADSPELEETARIGLSDVFGFKKSRAEQEAERKAREESGVGRTRMTDQEMKQARARAQGKAKTRLVMEFADRYRELYAEELEAQGLSVARPRRLGVPIHKKGWDW